MLKQGQKLPLHITIGIQLKQELFFVVKIKKAFQSAKQLVAFMLLFYLQIKPDLQLKHFQSST